MSFLNLAFHDEAFPFSDHFPPATFWALRVPPHKKALTVPFKSSIIKTPIFQNRDGQPLNYAIMRVLLTRLGMATGFKNVMTAYCLRRGFADAIHGMCLRNSFCLFWIFSQ